jgi:hypothetical protein
MRGHVLALAVLLVACADESLPPDLSDSPGALHNQVIEEFYRVYDGEHGVAALLEAVHRVLPDVDVDADDARSYALLSRSLIESKVLEDPDALTREMVRRKALPRADAPAFAAWVRDPSSPTAFAHRELAADVRSHSEALWASKTDSDVTEEICDMVGALLGNALGGTAGSIVAGAAFSIAYVVLGDSDEEGDDFWDNWIGPFPPGMP